MAVEYTDQFSTVVSPSTNPQQACENALGLLATVRRNLGDDAFSTVALAAAAAHDALSIDDGTVALLTFFGPQS
jgi:hypothetical protein